MTLSNQFRITLASNVKSICFGLQLCLGISVRFLDMRGIQGSKTVTLCNGINHFHLAHNAPC